MKNLLLTIGILLAVASPAYAQQASRKPQQPKGVAKVKPQLRKSKEKEGIPNAITAALRAGVNLPSSEMGGGFLPDIEAGYRIGMDTWAVEPAVGFQRWTGDREGTVTSSQLASPAKYNQSATLMAVEGRVRAWIEMGDAGFPLIGLGAGVLNADTEQQSFGVKREEAGSSLTWSAQAGWAYPIPDAYGNLELLFGYRGANVDFETTGSANTSGLQVLFGWHANF